MLAAALALCTGCKGASGEASDADHGLWSGEPAATLSGEDGDRPFGWAVASAGDMDGDGYADVAVGAQGAVYVYWGGPSDFGSEYTRFPCECQSYGPWLHSAGDVNGDGFDDLVIGTYVHSEVYLWAGGPDRDSTATLSLSGDWPWYGFASGGVGDVNGDGFADVAIAVGNMDISPAVDLHFGSADGMSQTPSEGVFSGAISPEIARAGDLNGDQFDDAYIGGFVYPGSASGLSDDSAFAVDGGGDADGAGDLNGDGYDDLVVENFVWYGSADGVAQEPDFELVGSDGRADGNWVGGAGDLDGDGFDDIVSSGSAEDGSWRVYIFTGSAAGVVGSEAAILAEDEPEMNGDPVVAGAGDVNGDGMDDIVVGAPYVADGAGRAWLYLGGSRL